MPRKVAKKKRGRPSIYTKALGQRIFERMRIGESARSICRDPKMPDWHTIWRWLQEKPDFRMQYALAKEARADYLFDEIDEIAGKALDLIVGDDRSDGARVQAVKLKVDTLKWQLGRLSSKYTDKVRNEHTGKDGGPIETKHIGRNGIEFIESPQKSKDRK